MTQWSWSMIAQTFIQWKQIVSSLSIILGTHRVPPSSATAPRHSINLTITTTLVTSIEQMNRRTELPTTKETTTDPTTIIMGIITVMLLCRHNTKTRLKSRVKNKVMNTAGLRIGEASFSIAGTNFWPPPSASCTLWPGEKCDFCQSYRVTFKTSTRKMVFW